MDRSFFFFYQRCEHDKTYVEANNFLFDQINSHLDMFDFDRLFLGQDGKTVRNLKYVDQIGFRALMQSSERIFLESEETIWANDVIGNLTNKPTEWRMLHQPVRTILQRPDLTKSNSARVKLV